VWRDLIEGLPHGLPRAGDRGLDFTPTWGRTYWGGAMYCLLADVEIRKRTGNRHGLQDALRGVLAGGGMRHLSVSHFSASHFSASPWLRGSRPSH
jgi:hypothetical protein